MIRRTVRATLFRHTTVFRSTAADERRRHRGGGVGDDRGRRAGGADHGAAGHVGGGGNSLERVTLVALCNGVIRTGGNRGGVAVGRAEPLIGNRGVGIVGARRRGQDLALDRTAADERRRHRGGGVGDDRGRRAGGAYQGAAGDNVGAFNNPVRVPFVVLCADVISTQRNIRRRPITPTAAQVSNLHAGIGAGNR